MTDENLTDPDQLRRRALRGRLANGDLRLVPVLAGLAVVWTVFQMLNSNFLSVRNLSNLLIQISPVGCIAVAVILILLLGEIDLAVAAVAGLCAGVVAVAMAPAAGAVGPDWMHGHQSAIAFAAAIVVGSLIGALHGWIFTRFAVPSFAVTLAALIGWQGALLYILGNFGIINLSTNSAAAKLSGSYVDGVWSWILALSVVGAATAMAVWSRRRRASTGAETSPRAELVIKLSLLLVVAMGAVALLNGNRGLPVAVLVFLGVVVIMDAMLRGTRFGRAMMAVGGNGEAARRAGINVDRVRIQTFALAGGIAGIGGILLASRLGSVDPTAGGGDILLNAIAAAVIGGTSLFGGRGSVWCAPLGILVIGSIGNGMDLLALGSAQKYVITALVLLTALTIDSVARGDAALPRLRRSRRVVLRQ